MKPETRKQEIINTSAKLFKEKGFSAVTMRDLAQAMGIKAASLYNHINSKQEILTNIIISIAEEFTKGMLAIMNSNVSSQEKLRKIIAMHVEITSNNSNGMASLNNDWMHLEDRLQYYLELRHNYEDNFRKIIMDGIEDGELKPIDPEVVLFSILSTLRSLYLWIPSKEDINKEELAANLMEVLLKGVSS
ncbi:MAG: TetR/AcrR family transcriptional regulator [Flavobacteriaceae bacterium]|nr:TetR/AcrR family transcriptional regulator [Bacteroidia bacterium]NNK28072.1 TetR/AcrR family transcriptional regulator [Flavobacteriaceae bacterium]NNL61418.1 TetR/AcrR family transcriptional regulator [Flavobacteriaceae bacterium]RZV63168.1 MAG: TetR/AcrR family transcriptional regulator [Flavobacteriaceae bacterium]